MGGSGGGGSSSGKVSYPAYMESKHSTWLNNVDILITAASAANPYTLATAYDPDTPLNDSATAVAAFGSVVDALDPSTDWASFWTTVQTKLENDLFSDSAIDAKVAAYKAKVIARLQQTILPNFQRGMQNVRAVMTSAFTIGESVLTEDAQRDINEFEANLKRDNEQQKYQLISKGVDSLVAMLNQQVTFEQIYSSMVIESNRIKIVAKMEESEVNKDYDEKDALWDLELYQYAGNVMASIGGASSGTVGKKVSRAQSAIGGALSGAASGAMMGSMIPGVGTTVGAVAGGLIGGIGGLF